MESIFPNCSRVCRLGVCQCRWLCAGKKLLGEPGAGVEPHPGPQLLSRWAATVQVGSGERRFGRSGAAGCPAATVLNPCLHPSIRAVEGCAPQKLVQKPSQPDLCPESSRWWATDLGYVIFYIPARYQVFYSTRSVIVRNVTLDTPSQKQLQIVSLTLLFRPPG